MNPTIEIQRVQATGMTLGRSALARIGGKVIILPAAVPGDILEIEIVADKRDYATGRIVRFVQPAPARRQPPCRYAARCGGCDWQQIEYDAQVRLKAELIAADFQHSLGIELDPRAVVEPAPSEFGYRSRVRLKTGRGGEIGFHEANSRSLVPVEECLVAAPAVSAAAGLARLLHRTCSEIEVVEIASTEDSNETGARHLGACSGNHFASGRAGDSNLCASGNVVLVAHLSKPPSTF